MTRGAATGDPGEHPPRVIALDDEPADLNSPRPALGAAGAEAGWRVDQMVALINGVNETVDITAQSAKTAVDLYRAELNQPRMATV